MEDRETRCAALHGVTKTEQQQFIQGSWFDTIHSEQTISSEGMLTLTKSTPTYFLSIASRWGLPRVIPTECWCPVQCRVTVVPEQKGGPDIQKMESKEGDNLGGGEETELRSLKDVMWEMWEYSGRKQQKYRGRERKGLHLYKEEKGDQCWLE